MNITEQTVKVTTRTAKTVEVHHSSASWGIFCFNSLGDLFLNSDWGMYGFAWRSFGDDFKDFLKSTNAEYIVGKFSINYREISNKKLPKHKEENLTLLVDSFIKSLNR